MTAREIVTMARERHALQRIGELEQLVGVVMQHQPRTVLEIGTFRGGTLTAWCQAAADDALLIGVDMPGGEFGGGPTPDDVQAMQWLGRGNQQVKFVRGDSHDAATRRSVTDLLAGREVDFLFIDGDHTFEGVSHDFENYAPLVAAGGLIALHDVVPYPEVPRCQVDRFWREQILPKYLDAREIRTDGDYLGCGIGTLTWPGQ